MFKKIILISILITFTILFYFYLFGHKKYYNIKNNNQLKIKDEDIVFFCNANLKKMLSIDENKKYIKKKLYDHSFYTINTLPSYGKFESVNNYENNYVKIFSDKPNRISMDVMFNYGIKLFMPKLSKMYSIQKESPNAILNISTDNGNFISLPVILTNFNYPIENDIVAYLRNKTNKHHLSSFKESKKFIDNLKNNLLKNKKIEDFKEKKTYHKKLEKMYGKDYMDYVLRSCKVTFTFMNYKDDIVFENFMEKIDINNITNINLVIDKGGNPISNVINDTGKAISNAANDAAKAVVNTAKDTGNAIADTAKNVTNTTESIVLHPTDVVGNLKKIGNTFAKTGSYMANEGKYIYNAVSKPEQDLVKGAVVMVAGQKAGDVVSAAFNTTNLIANSAFNADKSISSEFNNVRNKVNIDVAKSITKGDFSGLNNDLNDEYNKMMKIAPNVLNNLKESFINTCDCKIENKKIACTSLEKTILAGLMIANAEDGITEEELMGNFAEDVEKGTIKDTLVKTFHKNIISVIKSCGTEILVGKEYSEEISKIVLKVALCESNILGCISQKLAQEAFQCGDTLKKQLNDIVNEGKNPVYLNLMNKYLS